MTSSCDRQHMACLCVSASRCSCLRFRDHVLRLYFPPCSYRTVYDISALCITDSYACFEPSLRTCASYPRFVPSLYIRASYPRSAGFVYLLFHPCLVPVLHTRAPYSRFIRALHTLASYARFVLRFTRYVHQASMQTFQIHVHAI